MVAVMVNVLPFEATRRLDVLHEHIREGARFPVAWSEPPRQARLRSHELSSRPRLPRMMSASIGGTVIGCTSFVFRVSRPSR